MPVSTFSYSVLDDTLYGKVDVGALELEIRESAITIAIEKINVLGDVLTVKFKAALSPTAESQLDAVVAAHPGDPLTDPPEIRIQEELPGCKTGGHHQAASLIMNVDAGVDTVSTADFSYPIPISILSLEYAGGPEFEGDLFEVAFVPDTVVGVLLSPVAATDTVLHVSPTAFQQFKLGYYVTLDDTVNRNELGRVVDKDTVAQTITVENAATDAFAAMTTPVMMTVKATLPLRLKKSPTLQELGNSKIGGSYVPANTVMRVTYTNKEGSAKVFAAEMLYLY